MPILDLLDRDKYVTPSVKAVRLSICLNCPVYLRMTKRCEDCGCFVNLKTALITEACPRGKW